jgi:hypothetical protein
MSVEIVPNELTDGEGDYRNTILYRNAKAVMDTLEARESELTAMKKELQRTQAVVQQLAEEQRKTQHQVDTMWVKWMGHGSTE